MSCFRVSVKYLRTGPSGRRARSQQLSWSCGLSTPPNRNRNNSGFESQFKSQTESLGFARSHCPHESQLIDCQLKTQRLWCTKRAAHDLREALGWRVNDLICLVGHEVLAEGAHPRLLDDPVHLGSKRSEDKQCSHSQHQCHRCCRMYALMQRKCAK